MFDEQMFRIQIKKYPLLRRMLPGGIVTKKLLRSLLELEKWEADTLHGNLYLCGGIELNNSVMFHASDSALCCLQEIEQEENINEQD